MDNQDQNASGPTAPTETKLESVDSTPEDRTMAMLCHLLAIFTGFIAPLIIWLIKKDQSKFVDAHGKEALNFQITLLIAWLAAVLLTCVTFGLGAPLGAVVMVIAIIFCVMAALEANKGNMYRYPFAIRLIK